MLLIIQLDQLGTRLHELFDRAPLTFVNGIILVDDKVLKFPVVKSAGVQALHFIVSVAVLVVRLRVSTHLEVVFRNMRKNFRMKFAMGAPRTGYIDPKKTRRTTS